MNERGYPEANERGYLEKKERIRGTFNRFPDFFVQAFEIVLDCWKFSMLLLYILWDDWLISMILRSMDTYSRNWNTPY